MQYTQFAWLVGLNGSNIISLYVGVQDFKHVWNQTFSTQLSMREMIIMVSQKCLIIIHSLLVFLPSIIHSHVIGQWQHIFKKKKEKKEKKKKKKEKVKQIFSKKKKKRRKEKEKGKRSVWATCPEE